MTSVKAKPTVVLKANEVVVAEVDDALLWQRVLMAINGDGDGSLVEPAAVPEVVAEPRLAARSPAVTGTGSDAIGKLAHQLGLESPLMEGALNPSADAPFIHLNSHNWEAMRKQLPPRGRTAISPIVAASTLLCLWFRAAGLGNPTQAQALAALATIGEDDKNPSRGVRAATWLIARPGGQIQLNASEISVADKLGKAFCSKSWADWSKGKARENG